MNQWSFKQFSRWILSLLPLLLCCITLTAKVSGQVPPQSQAALFDVTDYDAHIEPDIANKTVKGKVLIRFTVRAKNLRTIELDCGELTIDAVSEKGEAQKFTLGQHRVSITLSRPAKDGEGRAVSIEYHGAPRYGIRFFPDEQQVYTIFSTSQWMPCVDAPDDRATLRLNLVLPATLTVVANGRLVSQHSLPDKKIAYQWEQDKPIPTYIFGFTAGHFRTVTEDKSKVQFRYLATQLSDDELRRIFRETPDMLAFFEERAGVPYADKTYTQILVSGNADQEMSSFTALSGDYGPRVLKDERDLWLAAHELAHQWWGNMVTCVDWNHFWLNEGFATFMAAAYLEHRFGREEYLRQIESYRASYEKVRAAGHDKSLVFPDWLHPTREDRTLVYRKGAYVLHLLREELGEKDFWAGIRLYTRKYFGKSVTTQDFQAAMEQASGKSLKAFFAKWVYLREQ
ncbi:MAG TPA: M1 family metallopeptidase [Pyrinomonadaceae bacterium]